jgi:opacity protein-like surface antigen
MKKTLILALLVAFAFTLAAQATSVFSLGVEGRIWKPDELKTLNDNDTMAGGALRMLIGFSPYVALDISGGAMISREEVTFNYGNGYREKYDVDIDVYPVTAGLLARIPLLSCLDLTAGGGAGYYWLKGEVSDHYDRHRHHHRSEDYDIGDDLGFYAVAGLDWAIVPAISIYGEVRYDWITIDYKDEFKAYAEEEGEGKDICLSGIGGAVGLRFNF